MKRVPGSWKKGLVAWVAGVVSVLVLAQAPRDLSVSVAGPGGATVGTAAAFTVGIGGSSGVTGITVTAVFLPRVTLDSSVPAGLCTANTAIAEPSTTVTCAAAGLSSLVIRVVPQFQGTLTAVVGVIGSDPDPIMANNKASAMVSVTLGATPTPSPTSASTPTSTRTSTPIPTATPTPTGNPSANAKPFWTDFDGDGYADRVIYRPGSSSTWYVKRSDGGSDYVTSLGTNGDIPVPGQYTGLVQADYGVFRPSTGYWYVRTAAGVNQPDVQWGVSGDIPVPGQYGGDGRTDYAVWRPSDQRWYIKTAEGIQLQAVPWGAAGDIPVPADYDGDGITDLTVFRPSNGTWYVRKSTGGTATVAFGASGDIPVPAALTTMTSRADYGIFRPSNARWYVKSSATLTEQPSVAWGASGDAPLPARIRGAGDARADKVVWRPSNGSWYVLSAEGVSQPSIVWGHLGDIPMVR
jgi:hypothetical protein